MVSMMADLAAVSAALPDALPEPGEPAQARWPLLSRLESTAIGVRLPDDATRVRRSEPAGCILYGPYLHLPEGSYRLSFRCEAGSPRMAGQPVLGLEVIVLSRFQRGWRDFTAADVQTGGGSLIFEVPPGHSIDSSDAGRFEFRFFHFGNASLIITDVELERHSPRAEHEPEPRRWRMLGRLQKSWIGRRNRDGAVTVSRYAPPGCLLHGGWPYLRLPHGHYRLSIRAAAAASHSGQDPVLAVEIFGNSRWRHAGPLTQVSRSPETDGIRQVRQEFAAADIACGNVSVDFAVPAELALETGADAPFDFRVHHLGNAGLRIDAVDLVRLGEDAPAPLVLPSMPLPSVRQGGRRRIVIIGNCQSETLRQGFAHIEALNRRFEAKYHFVDLQQNQRDFVARDLEHCDILLVQDLRNWETFPLRDCVPPGVDIIKFPLVRFASLWPFDGWNGPGDREAHDREAPNLTFAYLDGLLGRLRKEIPDKEARFEAYRALEWPGIINYRRLHQLEERRLTASDKQFGVAIGDFILTNFQKRPVFHTTVRPNWQVFSLLLQYVAKAVSVSEPVSLTDKADVMLRQPQVPVHPKVARELGVRWAHEKTQYGVHGRKVTWETYIRSYIEHYG
ncbi:MAG TPA: WcbI family polysaccharide biosynthesis putative acetyltransferase [Stellaceae bacterium]